jgi:hypothetical protein
MTNQDIAKIAHEASRAYSTTINEFKSSWEDLTDEQRASIVAGVEFVAANPRVSPRKIHAEWVKNKRAAGWRRSKVLDLDKKKSPNLIAFTKLDRTQQVKDELFLGVVKALLPKPVKVKKAKATA